MEINGEIDQGRQDCGPLQASCNLIEKEKRPSELHIRFTMEINYEEAATRSATLFNDKFKWNGSAENMKQRKIRPRRQMMWERANWNGADTHHADIVDITAVQQLNESDA